MKQFIYVILFEIFFLLQVIQAVQPHVIVVELCRARIGIMQLDEELMYRYAKNIDYSEFLCISLYHFVCGALSILYYIIYS